MPNGLAPNVWCRTSYLPVLYAVDTRCTVPCPLCDRRRCGLSVVDSRVEKGVCLSLREVIEQDLLPYMGQLKLAYVPIEGWIIDPDVQGLLDGSCDVVFHPTYYGKVVHTEVMTCGVTMDISGDGNLRYSLSLSPKVLAESPMYSSSYSTMSYLYLKITPCFLCDVVLALWGHQKACDRIISLEMELNPHFATFFLKLLLKSLV